MAKKLAENELRRQTVQALSDSLGPVDALRSSLRFPASLSTIKNGGGSIFRNSM
jgi:hypothetical protein